MSTPKKNKDKKKSRSILEDEIFKIMKLSMKEALDKAIDDLLKDWKQHINPIITRDETAFGRLSFFYAIFSGSFSLRITKSRKRTAVS